MDEKPTLKSIALSIAGLVGLAAWDFVSYLAVVLYMTGLAAAAVSGLMALGARQYGVQVPSFLTVWAGLAVVRILIRSIRLEI